MAVAVEGVAAVAWQPQKVGGANPPFAVTTEEVPLGAEELYCNQLTSLGLTKPMFGTEQPMPYAHSNDTELFLLLSLGPNSASPGP